ncbi:MAG: DUF1566 domain-containing protein [Nitrospirae bacterium]|nr:DUF1566 domain-containing protein [Nitrospirota bacterium]
MCHKKRSIVVGAILAITIGLFLPGLSVAGNIIVDNKISPAWNQEINSPVRFQFVLSGQGVLDKETGLAWEQSPMLVNFNWYDAQTHCNTLTKGNRMGWRLPTLQEIESLMDPSVPFPGPTLPPGHPFVIGGWVDFWSATTYSADTSQAWFVAVNGSGVVGPADKINNKRVSILSDLVI